MFKTSRSKESKYSVLDTKVCTGVHYTKIAIGRFYVNKNSYLTIWILFGIYVQTFVTQLNTY